MFKTTRDKGTDKGKSGGGGGSTPNSPTRNSALRTSNGTSSTTTGTGGGTGGGNDRTNLTIVPPSLSMASTSQEEGELEGYVEIDTPLSRMNSVDQVHPYILVLTCEERDYLSLP